MWWILVAKTIDAHGVIFPAKLPHPLPGEMLNDHETIQC
jgi:hypothetical protein